MNIRELNPQIDIPRTLEREVKVSPEDQNRLKAEAAADPCRVEVISGVGEYAAMLASLRVDPDSIARASQRMVSNLTEDIEGNKVPKKPWHWEAASTTIDLARLHVASLTELEAEKAVFVPQEPVE